MQFHSMRPPGNLRVIVECCVIVLLSNYIDIDFALTLSITFIPTIDRINENTYLILGVFHFIARKKENFR